MFGVVQLIGCASTEQVVTPVAEKDQAEAELAELFEDFADESGVVAETAPAEIDETLDPLDQIAVARPETLAPTLQDITETRVYDWRVIEGAMIGNSFTGRTKHRFSRPVALAVRSEYLYVVDAGDDVLYRFDLASQRLEALLDLKAEVTGEVADIFVAKDFSFYLTDTEAGRVLHFDRHGDLRQVYRDHFNMVRPVAVSVNDNGEIIVADAHYDHLLHFNSFGKLIATYGARGEGIAEFLNITAMAQGPDGYYVGSRVGRRLQVLGRDGNYLYAFEEGKVVFPAAIAVDSDNRAYVADHMDNLIKVFDRGAYIGNIGGFGTASGQFKRITDLWLDGTVLYVIDSLNGRVQAASLAPEQVSLPSTVQSGDLEFQQQAVEQPPESIEIQSTPEVLPAQE